MHAYSQQKSGLRIAELFGGPGDGVCPVIRGTPLELRFESSHRGWSMVYVLCDLEKAHYSFAGWLPEAAS